MNSSTHPQLPKNATHKIIRKCTIQCNMPSSAQNYIWGCRFLWLIKIVVAVVVKLANQAALAY